VSNLATRSITGVIFGFVVLGSIVLGPYAQMIVFSAFMVLGLNEFYNLFRGHSIIHVSKEIGLLIGIFIFFICVGHSLGWLPDLSVILVFPLFFMLILVELWKKDAHPILNISVLVFGVIYTVIPFYLTIDLNLREFSDPHLEMSFEAKIMPLVVGMYLLIWTNDTFAYLTGRLWGKTKLFERISPKKTWEGTIGGLLMTILAGYIIGTFVNTDRTLFWVVSAVIIAPCAVYGDLLESLFKRSLEIKDSGNILPGHGGILDRFDAALFAIPFFYCWTMIYAYF